MKMSSWKHITIMGSCIALLLFTSVATFYSFIEGLEEEQVRDVQLGEEEKAVKIIFPSTFLQSSHEKSKSKETGDWVFRLNSYPRICKEIIIPPPDMVYLLKN